MLPHLQAPHPADTPTSITKAAVFAIGKLLAKIVVKSGKKKGTVRQKSQNPVHIGILITEAQTSLSAKLIAKTVGHTLIQSNKAWRKACKQKILGSRRRNKYCWIVSRTTST